MLLGRKVDVFEIARKFEAWIFGGVEPQLRYRQPPTSGSDHDESRTQFLLWYNQRIKDSLYVLPSFLPRHCVGEESLL
jgi:hypothetical protein